MTQDSGPSRRVRVDEAEATLRSMISTRRAEGAERLPTEKDLSAQLSISRETLRAALTRLESEGQISRRRRVGTLIMPSPSESRAARPSNLAFPVNMMLSLSEYLQAVGVDYRVRSLNIRCDPATEDVGANLGLSAGSPVFVSSRLYEIEHQPAALLKHFLPTVLHGHEVHIESLTEGVTTFLRDSENIQVTHVESIVTASAASSDQASDLQLDEGAPVLVMHAKIYSDGPPAVAVGTLMFRPDVLCLASSASAGDDPSHREGFNVAPHPTSVRAATSSTSDAYSA